MEAKDAIGHAVLLFKRLWAICALKSHDAWDEVGLVLQHVLVLKHFEEKFHGKLQQVSVKELVANALRRGARDLYVSLQHDLTRLIHSIETKKCLTVVCMHNQRRNMDQITCPVISVVNDMI